MENVDLTNIASGERWEIIPNSKYQVSDRGRVRDAGGNILIPELGKTGYLRVFISGAWRFVHKLVAVAFVPNVEHCNRVVHRDGDRTNDNANNLVWVRDNAVEPDKEKEKIFKQYF